MLHLQPPIKSDEQLRAMAASGSSGFARKAQAALRTRMNERLAASLASQPANVASGSMRGAS